MPTGYTAEVGEGKVTSFRQFALTCARAFGALITMRDDPMDAPIPEKFEPSTDYHDKKLARARARREELRAMSPEALREASLAALVAINVEREKRAAENKVIQDRYMAMRNSARDWKPPTAEHLTLKTFMLEQLDSSIKHDCSTSSIWPPEPDPAEFEPMKWLQNELEKVDHDINYHSAERLKEIERAEGRTRWVQELVASLREAS